MKALLLTLALGGAAVAQTTVPALPPSATSTAATSGTSSPTQPFTLRFTAQPGTLLEFSSRTQQRVQPLRVQLAPLPNVRLTAEKERERQALEARFQQDFAGDLPQVPALTGKVFHKVLPSLADGRPVLLTTTVMSLPKGQPITTRLQQTLGPDGSVQTQLLDSTDATVQKLQGALGGLLNQLGTTFGGVNTQLFGQALTPGQSVTQTVQVDFGQLIGGVLSSVGGAAGGGGTGSLSATTVTTYRGRDAAGNALLEDSVRFDDTTLSLSLPSRTKGAAPATLQFTLRGMTATARSTVRPDGLSLGSSAHTEGQMDLTLPMPDEPYELSLTLQLVQDTQVTPQ